MTVTSNIIRIGTRASKLALAQVDEVTKLLQSHFPQIQIEVVKITTSGDKIQDRNLADIGGKGLFIKELEEALIQNKIDVAIHSAKDVPPILNETTQIAAFTQRFDVFDCFVSKNFHSLDELPNGAVIGTSSARRKAILLKMRPDLEIVNLRGNVDTRLNKIAQDKIAGSILAVCGLERLGKKNEIKEVISTKKMLPSGGQGALALQVRNSDNESIKIVSAINNLETQICVKTERAFLRELGASCVTPVAVYAHLENNRLNLETLILDYDGSEVFATDSVGDFNLEDGLKLGVAAAVKTKESAAELLKRITD